MNNKIDEQTKPAISVPLHNLIKLLARMAVDQYLEDERRKLPVTDEFPVIEKQG